HGSDEERRDWKRTPCPTAPLTTGAYSFGRPVSATRCAIEGRSAHATLPGHSLGPVSRWPEIARSVTTLPARNFEFPPEVYAVVESGSTCATSRRQASTDTSAVCIAGGGVAFWKLPISATPTVPVLKPSAWA